MSNLHIDLDELNKHDPKGFIPAVNNTFPVKDELGNSFYEERMVLPKAINFVDGTLTAPTTADGDIYILIGSGTVHATWGGAAFGDWVRFANTFPTSIPPLAGYLCFDLTAGSWKEYDGSSWAVFGGGGGVSDGDKGDISVTGSGATWTVDDEVVTFAKMQHIATNKILGRGTAGTGDVEELTISNDLQILLGVIGLNTTPLYISDVTTVNLLDDLANWTIGNYTGLLITGTFQGQNHYNSTYKFECVHDNVWIRILRS